MADLSNIARPYAYAAFEFAREKNELPAWNAFLNLATQIAEQPSVLRLLNNPEFTSEQAFSLFYDVLGSLLNQTQKNFLLLLAQNKRLSLMHTIAESYKEYYASYQKISSVRLVTAVEVGNDYKQKITNALKKRLASDVIIQSEINPAILGGAIIHIGDHVIDGSIRGKLNRLLESLTS